MIKFSKKYLLQIFFINTVCILWTLKTLYLVDELDMSPHKKYILISSLGFGCIIASILFFKRSKLYFILANLIYLTMSSLLYADVVYERYYNAILSIDLLGQAGQVGGVFDSIITLMYLTDFWYWIDLPIIILTTIFIYPRIQVKSKSFQTLLLLAFGILIIIFTTFFPLKVNYSDQYKIALSGIISAHLFNLFDSTDTILNNEDNSNNRIKIDNLRKEFLKKNNLNRSSELFGKYKGKNVIIVQAESLNTFPINLEINDQEITPTLNELIKSSYYYPNTYLQIGRGNTSDAEFVANNSIYPIAKQGIYNTYPNHDYLSLASVLTNEGYTTNVFHGNTPDFWNRQEAYKNQGYDQFYHINHESIDDEDILGLGISDKSMFNQMVNILDTQEQPFYSFLVTLSVHRPFILPDEYKNLDLGELNETETANYLQSVNYFDRSLDEFIKDLKEADLWDDTIFVLYGDHYGLLPPQKGELEHLFGIEFNQKARFQVPLIIHEPGQSLGATNEIVTSQMDIYPTLTTLLGIKQPLIQYGVPVHLREEGFAGFAYETEKYSFYSDDFDYQASHDGIFESGTCINNETEQKVDVNNCFEKYNKLKEDIESSNFLLENNLIKKIFNN